MDDHVYQRLLKAVKNHHGITLQPADVERIVYGLEAMAEDLGKLEYLADYFEYRYNQYVAEFGELDEQEGSPDEEDGLYAQGEAEGDLEVPETSDGRG